MACSDWPLSHQENATGRGQSQSRASALQVFDDTYFQVTADDLAADGEARSALCHAASPGILPIQWCLKNGAALERPRGYQGRDFDWADYLKRGAAEAAPDACFPDVRLRPNELG